MSKNAIVLTVGQLISEDLQKAYFFPTFGSSYCKHFRFLNREKYLIYDWPPQSLTHTETFFPQINFCTAGDKIPTLTDHVPPEFLKQHWKTWLPVFPLAKYVSVDDGLNDDDTPIVTCFAFEGIPKHKQSIDPDVLYKLQLKSSIPDIGVPCPRYMDEKNVEFPCVVKADLSYYGVSTMSVKNIDELTVLVQEMREKHGWRSNIVYQELIEHVKQVCSYLFYLKKTGEVIWLGTNLASFIGFIWDGITCDWNKQDEERNLIYDDFALPIKHYLYKHGYFGFVNFELVVTDDHRRYLVDLNVRIAGETQHMLMAPYMASLDFPYSVLKATDYSHKKSAQSLVEDVNQINQSETDKGRIVVLAAVDVDDGTCKNMMSIFGKTKEDAEVLCQKIKHFSAHENI